MFHTFDQIEQVFHTSPKIPKGVKDIFVRLDVLEHITHTISGTWSFEQNNSS